MVMGLGLELGVKLSWVRLDWAGAGVGLGMVRAWGETWS